MSQGLENDALDKLAESFVERLRQGERPSISEYATRHPDLADAIREFFPTLATLQRLEPHLEELRAAEAPPDDLDRLGDYHILRELGRGGMGVVYEAEQLSLGRRVALKVLRNRPGSSAKNLLQRFHREARSVGKLHHTNIVPVFDVGQENDVHYYAMQLIVGRSLDEILRELRRLDFPLQKAPSLDSRDFSSPIPSASSESGRHYYRNIADIGRQVAEGLAYAHGQGVLHRDIKPSNLILDTQGVVWITDFGLAKDEEEGLTQAGDIVGTLRYLAPERLSGRADARSDVYSLGLTLYELLTLRDALDGSDRAELVRQIAEDRPPPPRSINPQIPFDLETIVLKAIEKDPRDRYESSGRLAEDLQRFVADLPVRARPVSGVERVWRWCRRNPAVATLMALVATLLVVIALGSSLFAVRGARLARQLRAAAEQAEQSERMAQERLFTSYQNEARALRSSDRSGRRFKSLDAIRDAAALLPNLTLSEEERALRRLALRNQAIACLTLADVHVEQAWDRWPIASNRAAITFDRPLERIADADREGNVLIRSVQNGRRIIRLPGFGLPAWSLRFSPDGRYLAVRYLAAGSQRFGPSQVRIWNLADEAPILQIESAVDSAGLDFHPLEPRVAIGQSDRSIEIFDLVSGKRLKELRCGHPICEMCFDPAGRQLAVSSQAGAAVEIHDLASGKVTTLRHPDAARGVAWHPSENLLAVACADRLVYVWDTQAAQVERTCAGHTGQVIDVAFHPAGGVLASSSWDGTTCLWDARTGRQQLHAPGDGVWFSSDGPRLGFQRSGQVGVFAVASSEAVRTFHVSSRWGIDVCPNDRLLAVGHDQGVSLVDLASGREAGQLRIGLTLSAVFHSSGQELFTSGESGVLRWPVGRSPGGIEIGPPETLISGPHEWAVWDSEERLLLDTDHSPVIRIDPRTGERLQQYGPHPGVNCITASPDGRWIATSTWQGTGIRIWNADTAALEKVLIPIATSAMVAFSPDGRWLAGTTQQACRLWEVGTWRLRRRIPLEEPTGQPGRVAFSGDAALLALCDGPGRIRLIDPATGCDLAALKIDTTQRLGCPLFTRAGDQLLAASEGRVYAWDLVRIRRELAGLGLDWRVGQKPQPSEKHPVDSVQPLKVVVQDDST